jgi:hypothetical protein
VPEVIDVFNKAGDALQKHGLKFFITVMAMSSSRTATER